MATSQIKMLNADSRRSNSLQFPDMSKFSKKEMKLDYSYRNVDIIFFNHCHVKERARKREWYLSFINLTSKYIIVSNPSRKIPKRITVEWIKADLSLKTWFSRMDYSMSNILLLKNEKNLSGLNSYWLRDNNMMLLFSHVVGTYLCSLGNIWVVAANDKICFDQQSF